MNTLPALNLTETMENSLPAAPAAKGMLRKPRVWTTFVVWLAAVILGQIAVIAAYVAVGAVMGAVMGAQGLDTATIQARVLEAVQQPLPAMLLALLPFQLVMALVMLLAALLSKEPMTQRLGLLPSSGRSFSGLALMTMGAFTVSTAFLSLIGSTLLLGEPQQTPLGTAIQDGSWLTVTLVGLMISVIPALVEELLFRGYIQRRLLQRWSPAIAIGLSSLLFAIIHADSVQHVLAVVPLGLVTGMLAYRTNSVKPGMLVHAVHNAAAIGFLALGRLLVPSIGDEGVGLLMIGMIALFGLMGLPAIIMLLRGQPKPADAPQLMPLPGMESLGTQAA